MHNVNPDQIGLQSLARKNSLFCVLHGYWWLPLHFVLSLALNLTSFSFLEESLPLHEQSINVIKIIRVISQLSSKVSAAASSFKSKV